MALSCLLRQVCRNLRARHKSKNLVLLAGWLGLFDVQPGVGLCWAVGVSGRTGVSPRSGVPQHRPRGLGNSCGLCLLLGKREQNNYCHRGFHPYFIVAIIFISVRG